MRSVPPGQTVYSAGFYTLSLTLRRTLTVPNAAPLRSILCSVALSESAANAIIAVSTSYMKQILQMNAHDSTSDELWRNYGHIELLSYLLWSSRAFFGIFIVGIVFFIVLLSGVPGSQLGRLVTVWTNNPVRSLCLCNLFFIVSTLVASGTLVGWECTHRRTALAYIFIFLTPFFLSNRSGIAWSGGSAFIHDFWLLLGSLLGLVAAAKHLRLYTTSPIVQ
jgi:hypothetical protein